MSPVVIRCKAHAFSRAPSVDSSPEPDKDNSEYFDALPHRVLYPDTVFSSPSPLNSCTIDLSLSHIKPEQHSDTKILSLSLNRLAKTLQTLILC